MRIYMTIAFFLITQAFGQTNKEILIKLSQEEAYGNVLRVFEEPQKETTNSVEYTFKELQLKPKDVLYFYVPERLSKNPISQLGFAHRQVGYSSKRDSSPGLTSALVYSKDIPGDELRYWAGPSSGKLGAKFAEYRNSPEFDALYEWPKVGHRGIKDKERSKKPIRANVVRIQNIGVDNVLFSKLYLEVVAEKATHYQNVIFTPGSDFGDPLTMEGRFYGGGQNKRGKFPNSLRLDSYSHRSVPALPENLELDKNSLFVQMPVGSKLSSIDIMCGDTHPDGIKNKDGGWGSLGNAKVSIFIENKLTGEKRVLLADKNVGPQGVITASDLNPHLVFKVGDRIIIQNKWKRSTTYIMALRIGFNQ